jgi:hypothetical protein
MCGRSVAFHQEMNLRCPFALMCLMILSSAQPIVGQAKPADVKLVDRVKQVIEGPWTELHIAWAMMSDTSQNEVAAIEIKRDKPGGKMTVREISIPFKEFNPLAVDSFGRLVAALMETSKGLENVFTAGEIFASAKTEEERERLLKDLKMTPGGGEEYLVRSNAARGLTEVIKCGDAGTLEKFLDRELGVKRRQLDREEVTLVFGRDLYRRQ